MWNIGAWATSRAYSRNCVCEAWRGHVGSWPVALLSATQRYVGNWGLNRQWADIVDQAQLTRKRLSKPPIIALREQQHSCSLDHLVSAGRQIGRHLDAEFLRGI